jgi:DNA modification methylase
MNYIYNDDCFEVINNLNLNNKKICLLTDPPYGILGGSKSIGGSKLYHANNYDCSWDNNRLTKEQINLLISLSNKAFIFGYNYISDLLPPTNSLIVWDKKCKNNWFDNFSDGEIIWTNINTPLRIYRHLWMGALRKGKNTKRIHPTQKPVELMGWIIENFTKNDDIIFDPFMGSGSTIIACIELNRQYIGIEKNKHYFDIAKNRIDEYRYNKDSQNNLF